jgi:hypothetical protein
MIEYCCLASIIVILVFILLGFILIKPNRRNIQYNTRNHKKINGKICIKCGNVSSTGSRYCNHCGNEF